MGGLATLDRRPLSRRRTAAGEAALRTEQRRYRQGLWSYVFFSDAMTALSAPVVYSLAIPFIALDAWVTVYQAICFRAWGIARVSRRDCFVIDRHRLAYLNALEKLNCLYCSYANGVIAYVREVAARTEQYWCPIRHGRRAPDPHARYDTFARYGAAATYRSGLTALRAQLKK
jgi:hypothetical protein